MLFGDRLAHIFITDRIENEKLIGRLFRDKTTSRQRVLESQFKNKEPTKEKRAKIGLPCDLGVLQIAQTFLHGGDIDILAPRLLALTGSLLELLGGIY